MAVSPPQNDLFRIVLSIASWVWIFVDDAEVDRLAEQWYEAEKLNNRKAETIQLRVEDVGSAWPDTNGVLFAEQARSRAAGFRALAAQARQVGDVVKQYAKSIREYNSAMKAEFEHQGIVWAGLAVLGPLAAALRGVMIIGKILKLASTLMKAYANGIKFPGLAPGATKGAKAAHVAKNQIVDAGKEALEEMNVDALQHGGYGKNSVEPGVAGAIGSPLATPVNKALRPATEPMGKHLGQAAGSGISSALTSPAGGMGAKALTSGDPGTLANGEAWEQAYQPQNLVQAGVVGATAPGVVDSGAHIGDKLSNRIAPPAPQVSTSPTTTGGQDGSPPPDDGEVLAPPAGPESTAPTGTESTESTGGNGTGTTTVGTGVGVVSGVGTGSGVVSGAGASGGASGSSGTPSTTSTSATTTGSDAHASRPSATTAQNAQAGTDTHGRPSSATNQGPSQEKTGPQTADAQVDEQAAEQTEEPSDPHSSEVDSTPVAEQPSESAHPGQEVEGDPPEVAASGTNGLHLLDRDRERPKSGHGKRKKRDRARRERLRRPAPTGPIEGESPDAPPNLERGRSTTERGSGPEPTTGVEPSEPADPKDPTAPVPVGAGAAAARRSASVAVGSTTPTPGPSGPTSRAPEHTVVSAKAGHSGGRSLPPTARHSDPGDDGPSTPPPGDDPAVPPAGDEEPSDGNTTERPGTRRHRRSGGGGPDGRPDPAEDDDAPVRLEVGRDLNGRIEVVEITLLPGAESHDLDTLIEVPDDVQYDRGRLADYLAQRQQETRAGQLVIVFLRRVDDPSGNRLSVETVALDPRTGYRHEPGPEILPIGVEPGPADGSPFTGDEMRANPLSTGPDAVYEGRELAESLQNRTVGVERDGMPADVLHPRTGHALDADGERQDTEADEANAVRVLSVLHGYLEATTAAGPHSDLCRDAHVEVETLDGGRTFRVHHLDPVTGHRTGTTFGVTFRSYPVHGAGLVKVTRRPTVADHVVVVVCETARTEDVPGMVKSVLGALRYHDWSRPAGEDVLTGGRDPAELDDGVTLSTRDLQQLLFVSDLQRRGENDRATGLLDDLGLGPGSPYRDALLERIAAALPADLLTALTEGRTPSTTADVQERSDPPAAASVGIPPGDQHRSLLCHDGMYYLVSAEPDGEIAIWASPRLDRLGEADRTVVYRHSDPSHTTTFVEGWTVFRHEVDGNPRTYILYEDVSGVHVIESSTADTLGEYTYRGALSGVAPYPHSGTPFVHDGELYFAFVGRAESAGSGAASGRIFVSKMANPWTVDDSRPTVELPVGDHPTILRTPTVLPGPDRTFVTYIHHDRPGHFDLRMIGLPAGADPLVVSNWSGCPHPLSALDFGQGRPPSRPFFVTAPDGTERIAYHTSPDTMWTQPFVRGADGTPSLDEPDPQPPASGPVADVRSVRTTLAAEAAAARASGGRSSTGDGSTVVEMLGADGRIESVYMTLPARSGFQGIDVFRLRPADVRCNTGQFVELLEEEIRPLTEFGPVTIAMRRVVDGALLLRWEGEYEGTHTSGQEILDPFGSPAHPPVHRPAPPPGDAGGAGPPIDRNPPPIDRGPGDPPPDGEGDDDGSDGDHDGTRIGGWLTDAVRVSGRNRAYHRSTADGRQRVDTVLRELHTEQDDGRRLFPDGSLSTMAPESVDRTLHRELTNAFHACERLWTPWLEQGYEVHTAVLSESEAGHLVLLTFAVVDPADSTGRPVASGEVIAGPDGRLDRIALDLQRGPTPSTPEAAERMADLRLADVRIDQDADLALRERARGHVREGHRVRFVQERVQHARGDLVRVHFDAVDPADPDVRLDVAGEVLAPPDLVDTTPPPDSDDRQGEPAPEPAEDEAGQPERVHRLPGESDADYEARVALVEDAEARFPTFATRFDRLQAYAMHLAQMGYAVHLSMRPEDDGLALEFTATPPHEGWAREDGRVHFHEWGHREFGDDFTREHGPDGRLRRVRWTFGGDPAEDDLRPDEMPIPDAMVDENALAVFVQQATELQARGQEVTVVLERAVDDDHLQGTLEAEATDRCPHVSERLLRPGPDEIVVVRPDADTRYRADMPAVTWCRVDELTADLDGTVRPRGEGDPPLRLKAGRPRVDDVGQNPWTGNCGDMAVVAAVVATTPELVDMATFAHPDGGFAVVQHEATRPTAGDPCAVPTGNVVTYRMAAEIPVHEVEGKLYPLGAMLAGDRSMWPALLPIVSAAKDQAEPSEVTAQRRAEWEQVRSETWPVDAPTGFNRTHLGTTSAERAEQMANLTGRATVIAHLPVGPGTREERAEATAFLRRQLSRGNPVVVGTRPAQGGRPFPDHLQPRHAYAVLAIDDNDVLTLYDPHGMEVAIDVDQLFEFFRELPHHNDPARVGEVITTLDDEVESDPDPDPESPPAEEAEPTEDTSRTPSPHDPTPDPPGPPDRTFVVRARRGRGLVSDGREGYREDLTEEDALRSLCRLTPFDLNLATTGPSKVLSGPGRRQVVVAETVSSGDQHFRVLVLRQAPRHLAKVDLHTGSRTDPHVVWIQPRLDDTTLAEVWRQVVARTVREAPAPTPTTPPPSLRDRATVRCRELDEAVAGLSERASAKEESTAELSDKVAEKAAEALAQQEFRDSQAGERTRRAEVEVRRAADTERRHTEIATAHREAEAMARAARDAYQNLLTAIDESRSDPEIEALERRATVQDGMFRSALERTRPADDVLSNAMPCGELPHLTRLTERINTALEERGIDHRFTTGRLRWELRAGFRRAISGDGLVITLDGDPRTDVKDLVQLRIRLRAGELAEVVDPSVESSEMILGQLEQGGHGLAAVATHRLAHGIGYEADSLLKMLASTLPDTSPAKYALMVAGLGFDYTRGGSHQEEVELIEYALGGGVEDNRGESLLYKAKASWDLCIRTSAVAPWSAVDTVGGPQDDESLRLWVSHTHTVGAPTATTELEHVESDTVPEPVASYVDGMNELADATVKITRAMLGRLDRVGHDQIRSLFIEKLPSRLEKATRPEGIDQVVVVDGRPMAYVEVRTEVLREWAEPADAPSSEHWQERLRIGFTGASGDQTFGRTSSGSLGGGATLKDTGTTDVDVGGKLSAGRSVSGSDKLSVERTAIHPSVQRWGCDGPGRTQGYRIRLRHTVTVRPIGRSGRFSLGVTGKALLRFRETDAFRYGLPVDETAVTGHDADGRALLRGDPEPTGEALTRPNYLGSPATGGMRGAGEALVQRLTGADHALRAMVEELTARESDLIPPLDDAGRVRVDELPTDPLLCASQISNLKRIREQLSAARLETGYDAAAQAGIPLALVRHRSGQAPKVVTFRISLEQSPDPEDWVLVGTTTSEAVVNLNIGSDSSSRTVERTGRWPWTLSPKSGHRPDEGQSGDTAEVALRYGRTPRGRVIASTLSSRVNQVTLMESTGRLAVFDVPHTVRITELTADGGPEPLVEVDGSARLLIDSWLCRPGPEVDPVRTRRTDPALTDLATFVHVDVGDPAERIRSQRPGTVPPGSALYHKLAAALSPRSLVAHPEWWHTAYTIRLSEGPPSAPDEREPTGRDPRPVGVSIAIQGTIGDHRFVAATPTVNGDINLTLLGAGLTRGGFTQRTLGGSRADGTAQGDGDSWNESDELGRTGAGSWSRTRSATTGWERLAIRLGLQYVFHADLALIAEVREDASDRPSEVRLEDGTVLFAVPEPDALRLYGQGKLDLPAAQLADAVERFLNGELVLDRRTATGLLRRYRTDRDGVPDGLAAGHTDRRLAGKLQAVAYGPHGPHGGRHRPFEDVLAQAEKVRPATVRLPEHYGSMMGVSAVANVTYRADPQRSVDVLAEVHRGIEAAVPGVLTDDPTLAESLFGDLAGRRWRGHLDDMLEPGGFAASYPVRTAGTDQARELTVRISAAFEAGPEAEINGTAKDPVTEDAVLIVQGYEYDEHSRTLSYGTTYAATTGASSSADAESSASVGTDRTRQRTATSGEQLTRLQRLMHTEVTRVERHLKLTIEIEGSATPGPVERTVRAGMTQTVPMAAVRSMPPDAPQVPSRERHDCTVTLPTDYFVEGTDETAENTLWKTVESRLKESDILTPKGLREAGPALERQLSASARNATFQRIASEEGHLMVRLPGRGFDGVYGRVRASISEPQLVGGPFNGELGHVERSQHTTKTGITGNRLRPITRSGGSKSPIGLSVEQTSGEQALTHDYDMAGNRNETSTFEKGELVTVKIRYDCHLELEHGRRRVLVTNASGGHAYLTMHLHDYRHMLESAGVAP